MLTDDARKILQERSEELAKPRVDKQADSTPSDVILYLQVKLTPEWFGIPLSAISSVSRLTSYTILPGLPEYIAGIASHQGRVFTLIDLRKYLGLPSPGITQLDTLLVLEFESRLMGLLVDELGVVKAVPAGALQKPLSGASAPSSVHFLGVTADRESIISAGHLFRMENYPGLNGS